MEKEQLIQLLESLLQQVKDSEVVSATHRFKQGYIEFTGDDFWRQIKQTGELDVNLELKLYCHKRNELKSLA